MKKKKSRFTKKIAKHFQKLKLTNFYIRLEMLLYAMLVPTSFNEGLIVVILILIPANIQGDKDDAETHDDKQRLESHVMLDGGHGQTLGNSNVLRGILSQSVHVFVLD